MREIIALDFARYSTRPPTFGRYVYKALANAGFRAVMLYRLGRWCWLRKIPMLPGLSQRLMHHLCHCWIGVGADIGPGFLIAHVGGLVIGGQTRIGANCDVRRNVTFGGNFSKQREGRTQPWVGANVSFGAGASVLGPVRVGSGAIVGANSVVIRDVPENVIVLGVPAEIVRQRWDASEGRNL